MKKCNDCNKVLDEGYDYSTCPACREKASIRNKAEYAKLKAEGICTNCKKNPAKETSVFCEECSAKKSAYYKETRKMRAKYNICTVCGKEKALIGKKRCEKCAEASYDSHYRWRDKDPEHAEAVRRIRLGKLAEARICVTCHGKNDTDNKYYCSKCGDKRRKRMRVLEREKRLNRLSRFQRSSFGYCYICGKEIDRDGKICSECYSKNTMKQNRYSYDNKIWRDQNNLIFMKKEK